MDTLSLYHIDRVFKNIMREIEEQGGEITPEQEQALAINEENYIERTESIGKYILYLEQYLTTADTEIKRIEGLKAKAKEEIEKMKDRILKGVETYGRERLDEVTGVKIKVRKSDAVVIYDEAQIPDEFFHKVIKETTAISKTDIKKAIKEGRNIAGAGLEVRQNISVE